uniref:BTB domain-containing protein n=1 Tax=Panagrolaimus sp. ES5 TaxID=591445 RepID=A0AC34G288_9BILA
MDTKDDFLKNIQNEMNEVFKSQDPEFLDIVFEIEGKKLYADKLRLSVISSTFKTMLSARWNSKNNEPIEITNRKFEDFKEFLAFIYSGDINITNDNILNVLDMAEYYHIDHLKCLFFKSQDPEFLDTVFEIEGKKLYADKLRLAVISSTFKTMLSARWNSKNNEPIEITNRKFEDFKKFLAFLYSGEINITNDNLLNVLDMAEYYHIDHLKCLCDQILSKTEITFSNIFELIKISNKYSLIQLRQPL